MSGDAATRDQSERRAGGKDKWSGHSDLREIACRSGPAEESPDAAGSDDVCWVCLDTGSRSRPLLKPCACPRFAHAQCIARWQLQSAGTRKETHCEFCQAPLPNWKNALTPKCGSDAPAVMNVNFHGRTYSFEVKPGPQGYREFTNAIRKAFSLPEDSELNITFTCDEPSSGAAGRKGRVEAPAPAGSLLTLQGAGAYDAAVHCASVSAARRMSMDVPVPLAQGPLWRGGNPASVPGAAGGSGGPPAVRPPKARGLGLIGRRLRVAVAELFGMGTGAEAGGSGAPAAGGAERGASGGGGNSAAGTGH